MAISWAVFPEKCFFFRRGILRQTNLCITYYIYLKHPVVDMVFAWPEFFLTVLLKALADNSTNQFKWKNSNYCQSGLTKILYRTFFIYEKKLLNIQFHTSSNLYAISMTTIFPYMKIVRQAFFHKPKKKLFYCFFSLNFENFWFMFVTEYKS